MDILRSAQERKLISAKVAKQLKQQHDILPMTKAQMEDAIAFVAAQQPNMSTPMNRFAKRKRAGGFNSFAAQRGYWASRKFSQAKPWSSHGAMRVQRGTTENLRRFGATSRGASAAQKARRRMHGYTGRGSYFGKGLSALRSAGKAIGLRAARDSPIGKVYAGAMELDKGFDTAMDLYTGRGMYAPHTSANSLMAGARDSAPAMRSVEDETGALVITHRERVADIQAPSTGGFVVQTYDINPGLESFAPWLHQLASCYEEYQLIQCVYEYHGHELIGIQNSLDLQGQVIAATQYNVKLPQFTDRHEMTAYPHANQCSLNGSLVHGVEAHPAKVQGDGHKNVRLGGLLKDDDIRDYDHARFSLAVNNTPSDLFGKEIGQLYVYYTVKLIKPKISAGRGQAISTFEQYCTNPLASRVWGALGVSDNTSALVASKNTLAMTYLGTVGSPLPGVIQEATWKFPKHAVGVFRVTAAVAGSTLEPSGQEFPAIPVGYFTGGVSLISRVYPAADSTPGSVTRMNTQDPGLLVAVEFYLRVLPSDEDNTFKILDNFTTDGNNDATYQSKIQITEVNTLGNETGLPEVVNYNTNEKVLI